jgi:hypothetical protein
LKTFEPAARASAYITKFEMANKSLVYNKLGDKQKVNLLDWGNKVLVTEKVQRHDKQGFRKVIYLSQHTDQILSTIDDINNHFHGKWEAAPGGTKRDKSQSPKHTGGQAAAGPSKKRIPQSTFKTPTHLSDKKAHSKRLTFEDDSSDDNQSNNSARK